MPRCEMCGNKEASLTTVKTSQAELDVCSSCEELGTEVNTDDNPSADTKYSTSSDSNSESTSDPSSSNEPTRSTLNRDTGSSLRRDYGEAIREARTSSDLTLSELADEMNEKESHLRGIEKENRQPTEKLQNRLESKLNISLSSETEDLDDYDSSANDGTTLGDVVDLDN